LIFYAIGKTSIASYIINSSPLKDSVIFCHYFDARRNQDTISRNKFLLLLIEALIKNIPAYSKTVITLLGSEYCRPEGVNDYEAVLLSASNALKDNYSEYHSVLKLYILDPLKQRNVTDNMTVPFLSDGKVKRSSDKDRIDGYVLFVLDSIDEATLYDPSDNYNNTVIPMLREICKNLPSWIRIIATSRNYVWDYFRDIDKISHFILEASDDKNKKDVAEYVKIKLSKMCEAVEAMDDSAFTIKRKPSVDDVIKLIIDRSEGNFLFAYHVIHDVLEEWSKFPDIDKLISVVESIPKELQGIYGCK
jgi:hypothetical protein